MAEQLRAFIAVELSGEARDLLVAVQTTLRRSSSGSWVRWVAPEGIHLTLKFLGNIGGDQVDAIAAAVQEAVTGLPPFALATGALGVFPRPIAPRVIWLGLGGQLDRLGEAQRRIEQRLVPLGFVPEQRPFTPHLTLGRVREGAPTEVLRSLGQLTLQTSPPRMVSMTVSSVILFRSQLHPTGAMYTPLANIELRGN